MSNCFRKLLPVIAGSILLSACQGKVPVKSGSQNDFPVARQQVHEQELTGTYETTTQPLVGELQSANNREPVPSPSPEVSPVQSLW